MHFIASPAYNKHIVLIIMSSLSHDDNDIAASAAASTDAMMFNDGKWFDWDDGDDAFSVTAPTDETGVSAKKTTTDENESEEDDAIAAFNESVKNFIYLDDDEDEEQTGDSVPTIKKRRRPKKQRAITVDDNGSVRPVLPRQTVWYCTYVLKPDLDDPRFHKLFRRRFRLPHAQFIELGERLEAHEIFERWHAGKVNPFTNQPPTPIPLLLLTSLRYLGRGLNFDDVAECASLNEETVRVFFHCFIDFGSVVLYALYIRPPTCAEDAKAHDTGEYDVTGFTGAIGSTDATHILIERVAYRMRQTHIGFKMTHTARTYNITVNHRRQIMATTTGHPARWNDKTLALFDAFMLDLKNGDIMDDMVFDLYERGDGNTIVKRRYQGAWLLVDNGYLAWPTTVPPIKSTSSQREIRFSRWLESMRKDVEFTFGILKGRWRILKTGICLGGVEKADKIFLTCCALHNWLLDVDGLSAPWEGAVPTNAAAGRNEVDEMMGGWDGEMGQHDEEDLGALPLAIRNLNNPVAMRSYNQSEMGPGSDAILTDEELAEYLEEASQVTEDDDDTSNILAGSDHVQLVRKLSLDEFRKRLTVHFDIAYQRGEVKWPTKNGMEEYET